jgi:hypothetical protein
VAGGKAVVDPPPVKEVVEASRPVPAGLNPAPLETRKRAEQGDTLIIPEWTVRCLTSDARPYPARLDIHIFGRLWGDQSLSPGFDSSRGQHMASPTSPKMSKTPRDPSESMS